MFALKGKVYSDAGCVIRHKLTSEISFQSNGGSLPDFEEIRLDISNIEIQGNLCLISGALVAHLIVSLDKEALKAEWVKKRYSYDDQIAIMLNKDSSPEDALIFDKMQEWRRFASDITHAIIAKVNP